MFRPGIILKLGLAMAGFSVLTMVVCTILYGLLIRFDDGLNSILNTTRPLETASYELEIDALEVGLAVKGYIFQPDLIRLETVEDSKKDFSKYLGIYRAAMADARHQAMAADVEQIFSSYTELGSTLIDQQTVFLARRDALMGLLQNLNVTTREIVAGQDQPLANASARALRTSRFFSVLWADVAEALSLMDELHGAPLDAGRLFAQKVDRINRLLTDFSSNWPAGERPAWLDPVLMEYTRLPDLARSMVKTRIEIARGLEQFVDIGENLNDLLDNQIRLQSVALIHRQYDDLKDAIVHASQVLLGSFPLIIGMVTILLLLISRIVLRPVRTLNMAADIVSAGDLSHRVNMQQNDELGHLGQTFNAMTASLQKAHDHLSRTNAELDAKVEQRTRSLADVNDVLNRELGLRKQTEAELRDAVIAANAASTAKTLFLANMSHELRTPLNAIIGFSEVIRGQMFGPVENLKYLDYANDIHQSGGHLLQLINALLDISRIEAGELKMNDDAFDLAGCIAECLHMLEGNAQAREVALTHQIAENLPYLIGDETRIKQILINLIGNAIKFTPPQGLILTSAASLPDGRIAIKVSDSGIGIAADDLARVMEPFGQVANGLTRAHEGAGLGLPLAKRLTERHEGTLSIHSILGQGTTVTILLPHSRTVNIRQVPGYRAAQK